MGRLAGTGMMTEEGQAWEWWRRQTMCEWWSGANNEWLKSPERRRSVNKKGEMCRKNKADEDRWLQKKTGVTFTNAPPNVLPLILNTPLPLVRQEEALNAELHNPSFPQWQIPTSLLSSSSLSTSAPALSHTLISHLAAQARLFLGTCCGVNAGPLVLLIPETFPNGVLFTSRLDQRTSDKCSRACMFLTWCDNECLNIIRKYVEPLYSPSVKPFTCINICGYISFALFWYMSPGGCHILLLFKMLLINCIYKSAIMLTA